MAELIKTEAIVLHSIRWHESSKIITLYTKEYGLLKAIARGVFRKNSPLAGRLETLNLLNIVCSFKETRELQIITSADVIETFQNVKTDLKRLPYAFAILELLQKVMHAGQKDEVFFDFVIEMIYAIAKSKQPLIVFWYFLLKLCSYLGFKPNFEKCLLCNKVDLNNGAYFVIHKGGLVCLDCANQYLQQPRLSFNDIQFLQKLQTYPHKKIHQLNVKFGFSVDFTAILLEYLNTHLGHRIHLESLRLLIT